MFTSLKELNEIVDVLEEKTNQDILQAMFEVTGHLGLYGAQIKVTLLCLLMMVELRHILAIYSHHFLISHFSNMLIEL